VTGLPGIFTHAQSNVMADEMAKVGFFPSVPRKQMDGVDLTESQYADFKRISGRFFAMRLEANMDNPGWSDVPPQIKSEMMAKMLTSSRKMASIQLKIENPDLVESVARQKEQDIKDRFAR
jgi:hypothetical protein